MSMKYVCNPKTRRIIQVGGVTYKNLSKNPYWESELAQSPKSSSKTRLKKKCKEGVDHSNLQAPQDRVLEEKIHEEEDNWMSFSQLTESRLKDASKMWIESLTPKELGAIEWYVDSSAFINAAFRLGTENLEEAEEHAWNVWSRDYFHQYVGSHYTAFRTLREMGPHHRFLQVPFPIKLYRAVKDYPKYCKFMEEICIDRAPLSTSVKWQGAALTQDGDTLIVIHVPAETPLIPIYLIFGDETQKEVLLSPGTKLKLRKNLGNFTLDHFKSGEPLNNINVLEMDVVE